MEGWRKGKRNERGRECGREMARRGPFSPPAARQDAAPPEAGRCGFQPRLADGRRLQSMAVERAAGPRLAGDGSPPPSFSTAWKIGFHCVEKTPKHASIVWKTGKARARGVSHG